jgi:hypothetical protein
VFIREGDRQMTPIARQKVDVRDAMKFMTFADLNDAANNASIPAWARKMYAEEFARRKGA